MATVSNISSRRINARKTGDDEYERRRDKILVAAATIFREKGFEAASVDDIARKAGMDRASIYYYYKGKKELFREMIGEAITGNVLMAERIAATDDTPQQQLRTLIEGLLESYERHYPYLFVFVQEDMARLVRDKSAWSNKIRSLDKRFDQAIIKIIQAGLDDGSFHTGGDARVLAAGVIGMCNWSHRWFEPEKHDQRQIATAFSDMVLLGLTSPGNTRKRTPGRRTSEETSTAQRVVPQAM